MHTVVVMQTSIVCYWFLLVTVSLNYVQKDIFLSFILLQNVQSTCSTMLAYNAQKSERARLDIKCHEEPNNHNHDDDNDDDGGLLSS